MTIAPSRLGTCLAGAALLLALFACGEDTSPTATPTPAAVLIHGEEALLLPPNPRGSTLAKWDFRTPAAGTVGVTISYLHDTSRIFVWVTGRQCNKYQFGRDQCFYLTKSLEGPRPRTLTASGVRPGTYTLFVSNDGPNDEVIGYEVTLVPDPTGDRLSAGPPTSSAAR